MALVECTREASPLAQKQEHVQKSVVGLSIVPPCFRGNSLQRAAARPRRVYVREGEYLPGTVLSDNENGTYDVQWESHSPLASQQPSLKLRSIQINFLRNSAPWDLGNSEPMKPSHLARPPLLLLYLRGRRGS